MMDSGTQNWIFGYQNTRNQYKKWVPKRQVEQGFSYLNLLPNLMFFLIVITPGFLLPNLSLRMQ